MKNTSQNSMEVVEMQYLFSSSSGISMTLSLVSILIFLISMAIIAHTVKYPDKVGLNITLSTQNPPVEIITQQSGVIEKLYVRETENVKIGQPLLAFHHVVSYEKILQLENWLKNVTSLENEPIVIPNEIEKQEWGDLYTNISMLIYSIQKLNNSQKFDDTNNKINSLNNEKLLILKSQAASLEQRMIRQEQLTMDSINYKRVLGLQKQGINSISDVEKTQYTLIQAQKELSTINATIQESNLKMQKLGIDSLNIYAGQGRGTTDLRLDILQKVYQLKGSINDWKQKNMILSPISGNISFSNLWQENRFIKSGENIFTIIPNSAEYTISAYGKLKMGHLNEVEYGQDVQIELLDFPRTEYGVITGKLNSISLVPHDSSYLVSISIGNQLKTSFGKIIPFRPNLTGNANIITKDKSIFYRLFENVISIINTKL